MTPTELAQSYIALFDGNVDHAIKCVDQILTHTMLTSNGSVWSSNRIAELESVLLIIKTK